jgi:hypothetical protein
VAGVFASVATLAKAPEGERAMSSSVSPASFFETIRRSDESRPTGCIDELSAPVTRSATRLTSATAGEAPRRDKTAIQAVKR